MFINNKTEMKDNKYVERVTKFITDKFKSK